MALGRAASKEKKLSPRPYGATINEVGAQLAVAASGRVDRVRRQGFRPLPDTNHFSQKLLAKEEEL